MTAEGANVQKKNLPLSPWKLSKLETDSFAILAWQLGAKYFESHVFFTGGWGYMKAKANLEVVKSPTHGTLRRLVQVFPACKKYYSNNQISVKIHQIVWEF